MDLFSKLHDHINNAFKLRGVVHNVKVIDVLDESYTQRKGTSSADFPECVLQPVSVMGPLTASSQHTRVVVKYQVRISSGDLSMRVINKLVSWLMETMIHLESQKGIFRWNDYSPLVSVKFGDAPLGLSNNEANRNKLGFSTVASFEVELRLLSNSFTGTEDES
jgi:hypothetical protein